MAEETQTRRMGFGIVGLALSGFIVLGPGYYLARAGWTITGYVICALGALPLLYDIITGQKGLLWRLLSIFLPAAAAFLLCSRHFGKIPR